MNPQLFWRRKSKILLVIFVFCTLWYLMRNPGGYDYDQIRKSVYCDPNYISDGQKFILFPMITVIIDGEIGNQLFEVFSLLGIAKTLNRTAIFNSDDFLLHSKLNYLEERLPEVARQVISIPIDVFQTTRYDHPLACCHFQIPRLMFCEQTKFLFFAGSYFQSFKYFASIDYSIRKWLKPPQEEEEKLRKLVTRRDELRFKTCVHMRRGDFLTDGEHSGTDYAFAINAINHLYTISPGLVFLFSNEQNWARKRILNHLDFERNVRVMNTSAEDAVMDLYFSQIHCDSVLITAPSSTFGWWMGYLSKNMSNVYYRDIREVDDNTKFQMIEEDFYPPEWKKMRMTRNGRVYIV